MKFGGGRLGQMPCAFSTVAALGLGIKSYLQEEVPVAKEFGATEIEISCLKRFLPEFYMFVSGGNYKLDSDYIHRYLGELSIMEESQLMQLRKWVGDLQKGKVSVDKKCCRLRFRRLSITYSSVPFCSAP